MTSATELSGLNKAGLRALCRTSKIAGYGDMSKAAMIRALASDDTAVAPAKPGKAKAAPKTRAGRDGEVSVKAWLVERLAKGTPLPVADAVKFAEDSGRSKVTCYRQIREISHRVKDGMVVPD